MFGKALINIPNGEIATYSDIANIVDKPKSIGNSCKCY